MQGLDMGIVCDIAGTRGARGGGWVHESATTRTAKGLDRQHRRRGDRHSSSAHCYPSACAHSQLVPTSSTRTYQVAEKSITTSLPSDPARSKMASTSWSDSGSRTAPPRRVKTAGTRLDTPKAAGKGLGNRAPASAVLVQDAAAAPAGAEGQGAFMARQDAASNARYARKERIIKSCS